MNKTKILAMCLILLGLVPFLAGCQTTGESAGLGAALGAGLGAIIGNQSGNAGEGALIGAAIGGLSGVVAHDVKKTRSEKRYSAAQTVDTYSYQPTQGESLVYEDGRVVPGTVNRGSFTDVSMQYALMGSGAGKKVTETRVVRKDGEIVAQISSQQFTRNDGTWVSNQQFKIPESWATGEYTMEQTVSTINNTIFGTAKFFVN